jgi:HEAT repeat protein
MKLILILIAFTLAAASVPSAKTQSPDPQPRIATKALPAEQEEWDKLKKRYLENFLQITGLIWRLNHTYGSKTEMESGAEVIRSIAIALSNNDPATIRMFNGPNGLKQKLIVLMDSPDDAVSGFAARMLAIVGDSSLAPQIAVLLDRQKDAPADANPPVTVRGEAAIALSQLGAKQYAPRIAAMLRSKNPYDRRSATTALGLLKATEYAADVAHLLLDKEASFAGDDSSPLDVLFEMGVAKNHKKEIVLVLEDEMHGDKTVAAAYALARLGATEHAKDIAKLLKGGFTKGDAAKALALLGAKEYAPEIAKLLTHTDSFKREDGALALGILGARKYAPAIAKLLKEKEQWVPRAAALALLLLEAEEYDKEVLPIIERQNPGPYFDSEDLHPLLTKESHELDQRVKALIARLKERVKNPGERK